MPRLLGASIPFEARIAEIARARGALLEARQVTASASPRALADELVRSLGHEPPPHWQELVETAALCAARALAARDLAYSEIVLPDREARALAEAFVAFASPAACWLTNGDLLAAHVLGSGSAGWTPLTGATLDTGIVAVARERVAIFWCSDED